MAISKEELVNKINDWRKDHNRNGLADAYLEYLDSILEKEGVDTFVTDPDTGEEGDDYTPEFEATQAEVLNDLGLSDKEIDEIMGNENTDSGAYLNSISDGDGLDYYRYGPYTPEDEAKLLNNPEYKSLNEKITAALISGKSVEELRAELLPLMRKQQKIAIDILHGADNPVTSKTIIDKDDDGDADVTITKQDDGNDEKSESDEPHDEGLADDTTPEEDLMLNPDMSPSEFSKKAAEKRGAKAGEPAPDFNNFTNDIARSLANRRW